ncbi:crosslink repair DNA glycosylase YcaQ family protein [Nocardioides sp. 1609]|uniref:DNA glycosylase AlkZ-like family protein n=1 Tax=Nocardioides sp. 1609 TaxID=2508327 RepID=UPI00106FB310|nr:crosslink repair DNA glycosylase YcaQ family protein [Nocardioides sp. 1609]
MVTPVELSRTDARRVAVRAQLLTADRPSDVLDVVRHLTFVQLDPTNAVAPSADLVLWGRIGADYDPAELRDLVDQQVLVVHHMLARPAEDLALYRADMAQWPGPEPLRPWQESVRDWVAANDACRREVLAVLRGDGPLPASAFEDTCEVPWPSSGWNNDKNVKMLLAQMVERGEVARAGQDGRDPLWDLAERIYPDDPVPDVAEAERLRDEKRLRSLGIARARSPKMPIEPNGVGAAGVPAVVDGVKGAWRVEPSLLDLAFTARTALLSPLDRLVADRRRLAEVFEFDYVLEMYKPVAQRIWGFWAMPVLHGDRLVGKLDATADRDAGVLRVTAVHEDDPFDPRTRAAVQDEIAALADWLGLALELP